MIACAQIQKALMDALHSNELGVKIEAIRQLIRAKIITREVEEGLKQLLRGVYVEEGLSIIQESGYVTEEILDMLYSISQNERCSDYAKSRIANIVGATAKSLDPLSREKWAKTLTSMFEPYGQEETQKSIVRAVAELQCPEIDVVSFFLEVVNNSRSERVRIQAVVGLSKLGYALLASPYLKQVAQNGQFPHCFDALEEMIVSTGQAEEAISILKEMLENHQEHAWCMNHIMNCVQGLGKEKALRLVPVMLRILQSEDDPSVIRPIVHTLVWLEIDSDLVVSHLTRWLNTPGWSSLPVVALTYLIRLRKVTEQSLDRFSTSNEIWWDVLVKDWQKSPDITMPDAVRNRLISLSRSCQQSPLILMARVYLGGFSQEDFEWTTKKLNSPGTIWIRGPLLEVLSELWIRQGCSTDLC